MHVVRYHLNRTSDGWVLADMDETVFTGVFATQAEARAHLPELARQGFDFQEAR